MLTIQAQMQGWPHVSDFTTGNSKPLLTLIVMIWMMFASGLQLPDFLHTLKGSLLPCRACAQVSIVFLSAHQMFMSLAARLCGRCFIAGISVAN